MNKAIVISRHSLPSRPQVALIIKTVHGYSVCVVPVLFPVVVGQELTADTDRRGIWRLSVHGEIFPSAINGAMTMDEATKILDHLLSA